MKKVILKTAAILLILAGGMIACGKEKEEEKTIEIPFTEYSLVGTSCQWTNLGYDGKVITINSNAELEKYITCTDGTFPEIDFSKNTLLLASGKATSGIGKITPSFYRNSDNKYTLNISILIGIAAIVQNWSISIVAPTLPDNAEIDFNISQSLYE
jgi:hypothetical protein